MNRGEVVALVAGMLIGLAFTAIWFEIAIKQELKAVGIKSIVHCNNTRSNWCEIVWKEQK